MSLSPQEDGVVRLVNDMLFKLHVPSRVQHWTEITSDVFVILYEGLCGDILPDVIRQPHCREDEVHNCQSVIDTLSMDILNTSLSHIMGQDVVDMDREAISNLLDVFSGIMEYILDKIGSDISTDREDDYDTDPDLVTPEVIDSILDKELRKNRSHDNNTWTGSSSRNNHVSWEDDSKEPLETTADLVALGLTPPTCERSCDKQPTKPHGIPFHQTTGSRAVREAARTDRKELSGGQNSPGAMTVDELSLLTTSTTGPVLTPGEMVTAGMGSTAGMVSMAAMGSTAAMGPTAGMGSTAGRTRSATAMHSSAGIGITSTAAMGPTAAMLSTAAVGEASSLHTGKQHNLPGSEVTASQYLDGSVASSVSLPCGPTSGEATQKEAGPFDSVGVRGTHGTSQLSASLPVPDRDHVKEKDVQHTFTHHLYHHYKRSSDSKRSASASQTATTNAHSPLMSSLPLPGKTSSRARSAHKTCQSYENLRNLMRDTVEISRQAVKSSPLKDGQASNRNPQDSQDTKRYAGMSQALRSALHEVENEGNSIGKITRQTESEKQTNGPLDDSIAAKNSILSPKKNNAKKNVSFVSHSTNTQSIVDHSKLSQPKTVAAAGTSYPRAVVVDMTSDLTQPVHQDVVPQTFKDYLLKYYGRDRLRSYSDGEADYGSDDPASSDDHSTKSDPERRPLSAELAAYKRDLLRKAKAVRFDDILDDSAPGRMGNLRRKLKKEEDKTKLRAAYVDKLYEEDLLEYEDELVSQSKKAHDKAKEVDSLYKKNVLKKPNTKYKPAKKYNPSISVLAKRNRSRARSGLVRGRKRSLSASPTIGRRPIKISDHEIMPWLLEEFPYLHLTPQTMHHMWQRSSKQIEQLSRAEQEVSRKKGKAQAQIEEAENKQKILSEIMKKELKHNQRLNEIKERRRQTQSVTAKIRDKRLQSARCRKYYEEYQIRNRSKMLKKRSKEELIFKKLFEDGLNIQKDRIKDIRKYAREQRGRRAQQQQNQLESLENYYKDQYSLLMEAMSREREEIDIREKAQGKVLNTMKRELRKKMETEIEQFQEQLYRDEDEAYFRQLDADRMRHQLNMAKYQTKI